MTMLTCLGKNAQHLQEQLAANLPTDQRQRILDNLSNPHMALDYAAKYLAFLGSYRDYGDNHAAVAVRLQSWAEQLGHTTEYGRRIEVYRET